MHLSKLLTPARVLATARSLIRVQARGGYVERKVWICHLYDHAAPYNMTLESFKEWLVIQHRAGNLVLSRMDVARPSEVELVAQSETRYLNATWHRVEVL